MIETIKSILKLSPIPLSKNHKYDILTKKLIKTLDKNSNCIDVGCHKGDILDLIIKQAPGGFHFGIEPIPELYYNLTKKYLNQKSITLLNYAASNAKGESKFNLVVSNPSYSGLKRRDYDRPNEEDKTITVKTDTLDNLIPDNVPIHFIKIDVEGGELLVLEGANNIMQKSKPIVIFEHGLGASNHYDSTPQKIFAYFKEHGMRISLLEKYLKNNTPLSEQDFVNQFYKKINYYFVAHR